MPQPPRRKGCAWGVLALAPCAHDLAHGARANRCHCATPALSPSLSLPLSLPLSPYLPRPIATRRLAWQVLPSSPPLFPLSGTFSKVSRLSRRLHPHSLAHSFSFGRCILPPPTEHSTQFLFCIAIDPLVLFRPIGNTNTSSLCRKKYAVHSVLTAPTPPDKIAIRRASIQTNSKSSSPTVENQQIASMQDDLFIK